MVSHFIKSFRLAPIALIAALAPGLADAGALDAVKQAKTIRLAVRDDAPPFSFKDKDGRQTGYIVNLCRAVAKHLGDDLGLGELKIEYVPVTAADRFDAIQTGKADILCEATSETLSRRSQVDFSLPTFLDGASVMIKNGAPTDLASLGGRKVGVLAGTTTEQSLRSALAAAKINAEIVPAKTHEDGLQMLESGAIAAYFADRAILDFLAAMSGQSGQLRIANQYFSIEPYALALPRGDSDFRLAVDRALSHIYKTGEIATIFANSFGAQTTPTEILKTVYLTSTLPD